MTSYKQPQIVRRKDIGIVHLSSQKCVTSVREDSKASLLLCKEPFHASSENCWVVFIIIELFLMQFKRKEHHQSK